MSLGTPAQRAPGWRQRVWPDWMTRDVSLVIFARLAMSATRALAGVVVPIYLALIGFDAVGLGLLFVVVAITSAVLSSLVGLLSDRIGRKPFLIALPLFAAVAALVFAVTRNVPLLVAFAALGSFGRGAGAGMIGPYQPAEQALLADAAPARARNDVFGRVAFFSSLGALVGAGPLAALPDLLPSLRMGGADGMAGYRVAFVVMAALAALAAMIVLPIHDVRPAPTPRVARAAGEAAPRRSWNPLSAVSATSWPILLRLWATNSVNGLAIGFFGPFITYWFYRRYGAGPATIGALYSIINIAALASNLYAPRLAARLGLVRAITWGRVLQALLMIPMVLAPTFWLAGVIYLLRMQAQRIALPLRQSYVMAVVPPRERGTVGALSNLPMQVTSAVSPALAGYIFANISLALPFEIGAALQGLNALMFYFFFHEMRPPEERGEAQASVADTALADPDAIEMEGGDSEARRPAIGAR